jgi:hypothetical protein
MTKGAWRKLDIGDVLRNRHTRQWYVVHEVYPGRPKRIMCVRINMASDPDQWDRITKREIEARASI